MDKRDRRIKRKADSWLGTLVYHTARNDIPTQTLSQRLQGIITPLLTPETIKEATNSALGRLSSSDFTISLKDRMAKGCASDRVLKHISVMHEVYDWRSISPHAEAPQTLGELIERWAELTKQDEQDFQMRIYPRLVSLSRNWWRKTKALGLTDEEVFKHPEEAAEFMSGLIRLLIAETPTSKMNEIIRLGFQELANTSPDAMQPELQHSLAEAADFTTWRTCNKIGNAFEQNPDAREAISTPEVTALVMYEEARQGWNDSTDKATELLNDNLASELDGGKTRYTTKTALLHALNSLSRRSLISNLSDAIKGKLRYRLIQKAQDWVRKQIQNVELKWQFTESAEKDRSASGIRSWLFRR